jgi:hypothetical protein
MEKFSTLYSHLFSLVLLQPENLMYYMLMYYDTYIHKETPCVAILNKQKCHLFSFTKLDNRIEEQALPGGDLVPEGEERWGKGVGG